jgi:hypothetical protein
VLFGPQLARQDLRSGLANTDILKTYPLRGWQVMLGEILTPAAILTVVFWLMLLAAAMLLPYSALPHAPGLTPSIRLIVIFGIAMVAPLLCMSQLVIANTATVLVPAWSKPGVARTQQGIEVMGQRILFLAGQLIGMAVMLLPAVFLAGIAGALSRWLIGSTAAAAVAAVVAVAVLAVEVGAAIYWLGGRFERLDLSQELRP